MSAVGSGVVPQSAGNPDELRLLLRVGYGFGSLEDLAGGDLSGDVGRQNLNVHGASFGSARERWGKCFATMGWRNSLRKRHQGTFPRPGGRRTLGARKTVLQGVAWWERCWPSSTTNGPRLAATSPSPTPTVTMRYPPVICWKQRPDQRQRGRRAFTLLVCCSSPVDRPICGAGERGASFTSG